MLDQAAADQLIEPDVETASFARFLFRMPPAIRARAAWFTIRAATTPPTPTSTASLYLATISTPPLHRTVPPPDFAECYDHLVPTTPRGSLTATLSPRPDGAAESLLLNAAATTAAAGAGLTVLYTPGTGVLSITGPASTATYQTILQGIQYNNTSDTPTTTSRNVDVRSTTAMPPARSTTYHQRHRGERRAGDRPQRRRRGRRRHGCVHRADAGR